MEQTFAVTFYHVQNASIATIHQHKKTGEIEGFLLPFLGQRDERVPDRPTELVHRESIIVYPINFNAMSEAGIESITKNAEQLTNHLLQLYWSASLSEKPVD